VVAAFRDHGHSRPSQGGKEGVQQMVSRLKVVWLTALLGVAFVATSATPVAAAKPTVRIPTSAADWATFTPAEKDATIKWVWDQKARMEANGTWTWTEATGSDRSSADFSGLATTAAMSGGVNCGIKTNQQPWATYATGWASTYTTATIWGLDTGLQGYKNKLFHNGTVFSQGWGAAAGGATYVYAESSQDFKFPWDSVTWQVQSWGSAQYSATLYLFKNRYCGKTVVG
jgi:hypothetical protein